MVRRVVAGGALVIAMVAAHPGPTAGYSTNSEISVSRAFSRLTVAAGESVDVTLSVTIGAIGADPLRGFYLADHLPDELVVTDDRVTVDGAAISAITESSVSGGVYAGCTTQRWVLETPPGWSQSHPLSAGTMVVIRYTVTVPADTASTTIHFPGFSWVGMIAGQGSAGDHFGYEDGPPSLTVTGQGAADGGVDPADNPEGKLTGGCSVDQPGAGPIFWLLLVWVAGRRRRHGRGWA